MLRCGNLLKLHKEDADRLFKLTGADPNWIRSVEDLNCFVELHLQNYDDSTPESRLLGMLLADEKLTPLNEKATPKKQITNNPCQHLENQSKSHFHRISSICISGIKPVEWTSVTAPIVISEDRD